MGKQSKVTESLFNAIRIMLKGGATQTEISEYMNVSTSTVSNIKMSDDYEDYRHRMYVSSGAYRKRMAAMKAKEEAEKRKQAEEVAKKVGAVKATEIPVVEQKPLPVTQVVEHRQTVQITATHYMMEELKQMNDHLKLISNKLAFIVEELTGTKGGMADGKI